MNLHEKYKEETGYDVGAINTIGTTYYSGDYVEWLEKQLLLPRVINWVACKDKLPTSGKFYMTWDGFRIELTYRYDNPKFFTNEREVTHWMELPEPPCL